MAVLVSRKARNKLFEESIDSWNLNLVEYYSKNS